MTQIRSFLFIPLVVVALLGGTLGFIVARQLAPTGQPARVSVVTLPSTPTPPASPSPASNPSSGSSSSGRHSGGGHQCPAGCQCSFPPPNGIVIHCGG